MEKKRCSSDVVLAQLSRRAAIFQLCETRRLTVLLLLAGSALPCAAAKPVTVEQLEQILATNHNETDAKVAAQLSDLVLIERLSAVRLSSCEAGLPGPHARQALMVLADMSAFLSPPAAEIPDTAKPDPKAQREMVTLTVNYVSTTVHQLPNF